MLKKNIKTTLLSIFITLILAGHIQAQKVIYHGNSDSKIYHSPHCRYYDCKKCTIIFESKQEAENAGFRPCKICRP